MIQSSVKPYRNGGRDEALPSAHPSMQELPRREIPQGWMGKGTRSCCCLQKGKLHRHRWETKTPLIPQLPFQLPRVCIPRTPQNLLPGTKRAHSAAFCSPVSFSSPSPGCQTVLPKQTIPNHTYTLPVLSCNHNSSPPLPRVTRWPPAASERLLWGGPGRTWSSLGTARGGSSSQLISFDVPGVGSGAE